MKVKDLSAKERKQLVRDLINKYEARFREFERTWETKIAIYCRSKSTKEIAVRESIVFCFLTLGIRCSGCKRFRRKMYVCEHLGCGSISHCLKLTKKKYLKYCKKTRMLPRKKDLTKGYRRFFNNYDIYRGLRTTPKRALKHLEENGKVKLEELPKKKKRKS